MQNKPSQRKKMWDPASPILQTFENRTWQLDPRRPFMLEPHSAYTRLMTATYAPENAAFPASCFATRPSQDQINKNVRKPVNAVAWTPDGRRLWSGHANGIITAWNGATFGYECHNAVVNTAIRAIQWMHNGNVCLLADDKGFARYLKANMSEINNFQIHDEPVRALSFSPDDMKFASGGDDGLIRIYNFWDKSLEVELKGSSHDVRSIAWHPKLALIASGGKDSAVRLWDPNAGKEIKTIHCHKSYVRQVAWNNTGNWLLTTSNDRTMKIFELRMMKEISSMLCEPRDVASVAWHPHIENMFVAGHQDGYMSYWIGPNPKPLAVVKNAHEQAIWSLDWHPAGHVLATGGNDFRTKFWCRQRPGDPLKTFKVPRMAHFGAGEDDDAGTPLPPAAPGEIMFRHRDDDYGVPRAPPPRAMDPGRSFGGGGGGGGGGAFPPSDWVTGTGAIGPGGKGARPPPEGYTCRSCNKKGHWREQCPERRGDGGPVGSSSAPPAPHSYGVDRPKSVPGAPGAPIPPPSYICKRCGCGGHYLNDCINTPIPPPPDYRCNGCGRNDHWKQDCPKITARYGEGSSKRFEDADDEPRREEAPRRIEFDRDVDRNREFRGAPEPRPYDRLSEPRPYDRPPEYGTRHYDRPPPVPQMGFPRGYEAAPYGQQLQQQPYQRMDDRYAPAPPFPQPPAPPGEGGYGRTLPPGYQPPGYKPYP